MNGIAYCPVRDRILVERTTPIKQLSRRDKICKGNIAYLTARFVAGRRFSTNITSLTGLRTITNYELKIKNYEYRRKMSR